MLKDNIINTDDLSKELRLNHLAKLGKGSFGLVFVGEREDGLLLVVKVQKESRCMDSEWNWSQKLRSKSPFLIQVYERVVWKDFGILKMEFANAGTLSAFLRINTISRHAAAKILFQLLNGIRTIHENCLMHREIKPDHILINRDKGKMGGKDVDRFTIKICDFSLTGEIGDLTCAGTPLFMAPENLNQEKYDEKCDMWACGIVFYLLLMNGNHPFKEAQSIFDLQGMVSVPIVRPLANPPLENDCWDILTRMLQINPADRISAADALRHPFFRRRMIWMEDESETSAAPIMSSSVSASLSLSPPLSLSVSVAFEVQNGFAGMLRDIIVRLLDVLRFNKQKVRAVLGMSADFTAWKDRTYFIASRKNVVSGWCFLLSLPPRKTQ